MELENYDSFPQEIPLIIEDDVFLYPFNAFFTLVAFRHEKDSIQRQLNKEIFRQMLSWPVVMGETLILLAKKP